MASCSLNPPLLDEARDKARIETQIRIAVPAVCTEHVPHANIDVGMEAVTALGLERGQVDYSNKKRDSCAWLLKKQADDIARLTAS